MRALFKMTYLEERFGSPRVVARESGSVSDQQSLVDLLRNVSVLLAAIRKSIAASGHLNEIIEIDTLLAIAQSESDKRVAVISRTAGYRG